MTFDLPPLTPASDPLAAFPRGRSSKALTCLSVCHSSMSCPAANLPVSSPRGAPGLEEDPAKSDSGGRRMCWGGRLRVRAASSPPRLQGAAAAAAAVNQLTPASNVVTLAATVAKTGGGGKQLISIRSGLRHHGDRKAEPRRLWARRSWLPSWLWAAFF